MLQFHTKKLTTEATMQNYGTRPKSQHLYDCESMIFLMTFLQCYHNLYGSTNCCESQYASNRNGKF